MALLTTLGLLVGIELGPAVKRTPLAVLTGKARVMSAGPAGSGAAPVGLSREEADVQDLLQRMSRARVSSPEFLGARAGPLPHWY